jgi:hypothetical protein
MMKAIRMKREGLHAWPDGDKGAKWHDPQFLAERCSIEPDLRKEMAQSTSFSANWLVVRDWFHESRYPGYALSQREARDMLTAVASPTDGLMPWLLRLYRNV